MMTKKSIKFERFAMTLPQKTFETLEKKRGPVPRSIYVRTVLKKWWKEGHSLEELREGYDGKNKG